MRFFLATLVAAALCAGASAPATAASGIAYDEILKFVQGADVPPPGTFETDYASLSQRAPMQQRTGGGLFGRITAAANNAGAMMRQFTDGMLEHHSYLGSLSRTDNPYLQTSTITNCDTMQRIEIDHARKTYRIIDMNARSSGSSGSSSSSSSSSDNSPSKPSTARTELTVTTSVLGNRTLSGYPATGYRTVMSGVTTDQGKTSSFQSDGTTYYASLAAPSSSCHLSAADARAMSAMSSRLIDVGNLDPRFTVKASGPRVPAGRLALYLAQSFSGAEGSARPQGGPAGTMLLERGNIKTLSDADRALFSPPAGYKQET